MIRRVGRTLCVTRPPLIPTLVSCKLERSLDEAVDTENDLLLALTPFWKNQNAFWSSSDVRDIRNLGYTYPEFQGLDMNNKDAVRSSILDAVNRLYGPGSPPMQRRGLDVVDLDLVDGDNAATHGHSAHSRRHRELARRARYTDLFKGKYSDWTVRVSFNHHEVGQSFSVLFFLDEIPSDPQEWLVSPHLVGAHHAFVYGNPGGECSTCSDDEDMVEEGFVPLNPWIAEHSGLGSFDAHLVEPFLTDRLQWRVQKVGVEFVCATVRNFDQNV